MGKVVSKIGNAILGGGAKDQARGAATEAVRAGQQAARQIKTQPFEVDFTGAKKRAGEEQKRARDLRAKTTGAQADLREQLAARARGEGPSLAEAQMRQSQDRSLAQQLAAAASARGGSPAALQRQLAQQQAAAGQQIAQDAATARIQETQAAQQQLGQELAQQRQLEEQSVNKYLNLGLSIEQAEAAARQDLEKLRLQARTGIGKIAAGAFADTKAAQQGLIGGLLGGGAQLLASDKALKKNVKDGQKSTSDFLNALSAKQYDYKSKAKQPKGKNYGIMAQDLEKSKMGKSLVVDTPDGKMVDTVRGFGAALAGMAELNRRTAEIERAMKRAKVRKSKKES